MANRLARIAPGLSKLLPYGFAENFRHDLLAGLSVAAVALPVAVAYAQLAGFDPVVGSIRAFCRWWRMPCSVLQAINRESRRGCVRDGRRRCWPLSERK